MEKVNLKEFEEKIISYERKKKSKKLVRIFALTVGQLIFILGLLTTIYKIAPLIFEEKAASFASIEFFNDIYNIFFDLSVSLDLPGWTAYVFLILASIIIPVVFVLIFNIFSVYLVKKEASSKLSEKSDINSNIENTKNLIQRIKDNCYFESEIEKRYSLTGLLIYFGVIAYILYFISKSTNVMDTERIILFILFIAVFSLLPFIILRIIYFSLVRKIWEYWYTKDESKTKENLEKYLKALNFEKKKIDKEEKIKKEQEQAEMARKQKKQNLIKANELYKEATKSDEIEENLMKKAADLEHPEACLYFGKKLMEDYASDKFTKKEKSVIIKDAKKYLSSARKLNTEANFLYINSSVLSDAKDIDEWKFTLKELRSIEASGTLPEIYADACSTAISIVVDTIDKMDANIEKKKNYKPKIKRCYCKFFNAGICGRESNSTITYHCNYHDNPAACSTARTYNGVVYEFDE